MKKNNFWVMAGCLLPLALIPVFHALHLPAILAFLLCAFVMIICCVRIKKRWDSGKDSDTKKNGCHPTKSHDTTGDK
jgi:hypothetical protein